MKERVYFIETKAEKILVKARNRDEAFAKFFNDILDGKVPLDTIGNIIILHDRKEKYPFRTVPLLWQLKVIDTETALTNIIACTGVSEKDAKVMLFDLSFKDSRLIPIMNKMRGG